MKRTLLFAISITVLSVIGCAREYTEVSQVKEFVKKDPDATGAIKAVRGYNKALILTYMENDTTPLKDYATDRELNKVQHLIEGFLSQNLRMDAELKQMRIDKVERWGPNNVVVTTYEKWRYRRVNARTGEVVKPLTDIEYRLMYIMGRNEAVKTWKVFNLQPV